jgi:hypothetical protein
MRGRDATALIPRHKMRGCLSSETTARSTAIPPELVHAVATIARELLEASLVLDQSAAAEPLARQLRLDAWRIMCAWVAALDGDIDDLEEHVRLEEVAGRLVGGKSPG